jgi:predicted N-acetyltransferase YhbS
MLAADEFLSAYGEGRVLKAVDERGNIVGMLLQEYDHDVMHFGPLAVLPEWCGRGVGRALIYKAMEMARSKGARTVEISVINLRDELVPFYERMGFVKCGEAPYPLPERLSRPCHFVLYKKDL